MIPSNVPAKSPQKRDIIADCGAQGPMSQQDVVGTAMRCIRKNLCGWSAVMIPMQENIR